MSKLCQQPDTTGKIIMIDLAYSIADQDVETTKSIGIYNFSLHLAQHLSEHAQIQKFTVFSNSAVSPYLRLAAKARVQEFDFVRRSKVGRVWWDQWGLYHSARATGHRWLFLPKGFCSFMARPRLQVATFVHDIMGDFYRQRYPGFESRLESFYFARSLAATLRQSQVIFTNTEFSKRELRGWAGRRGLRVPRVVVTGYGFAARKPSWTEKENRVLLFASDLPHKRTDIAIRFLTRWLRESKYDGVIDCIGILSPRMARPEGPGWNWIGRVLPDRAYELMRRARVVIYVSEYEGFGMPPVEAVLEGSCPVFSDIPPLREAMGQVGCPFSNDSEESFLQAMNRALTTSPKTIHVWAAGLLRHHHWPAVAARIVQELCAA
jgi:glycosyltransferase involved in cell wall biosynthesis